MFPSKIQKDRHNHRVTICHPLVRFLVLKILNGASFATSGSECSCFTRLCSHRALNFEFFLVFSLSSLDSDFNITAIKASYWTSRLELLLYLNSFSSVVVGPSSPNHTASCIHFRLLTQQFIQSEKGKFQEFDCIVKYFH